MLAYLQRLLAALLARNAIEARRLLNHPLSTMLPLRAREEAQRVSRGQVRDDWRPIHLAALCEEAEQLLAEEREPARGPQLELPLGPTLGAFDLSLTIARAAAPPRPRRTTPRGRLAVSLREVG
jgi:hypothetical protein